MTSRRVLFTLPFLIALLFPTSPEAQVALPAIDAEISAMVESVSVDSLYNVIDTLTSFTTRHTNSDTTSNTFGVGAARRWVYNRLQEIGNATGNLTVDYHSFVLTIQGVTKEHRNVVGTITGTDPAQNDRVYIIGGHLDSRNEDSNDSTGFAHGANDDASGVGAALEVARILAQNPPEATVKFIAFVGEEQGLFGSTEYAQLAVQLGMNIEGMLNNDMVGNVTYGEAGTGDSLAFDSTHVRMFSVGPSNSSSRQMARAVKLYGETYVPSMEVNLIPAQDRPNRGGDHIPFNDNGFTAVRLVDVYDNLLHQHNFGDTIQVMNFPYYARNVGIDVATLAGLANAPRPLEDFVVGNTGDSTGFTVSWDASDATDLGGYYVTIRGINTLYWDQTIDVGNVTDFVIASSPSESLWVGAAAYDTSGHLGLVTEELGVLSTVPAAPTGLVATPDNVQINLSWNPAPEGDFSHHNLFRASAAGGPYTQIAGPLALPSYADNSAALGTFHYYKVSAVDTNGTESAQSEYARGRVASLDQGVLLVEESEDGTGQPHSPADVLSDGYYATVLANTTHDVFDYDSAAAADGLTLSDIGAYSSVIWVSDDRDREVAGVPVQAQFLGGNLALLKEYLDVGGNVLLIGWRLSGGVDPIYPGTYAPGDVLYDYFGVADVGTASPQGGRYFYGATGALGYPDVTVDTAKTRTPWGGKLPDADYLTTVAPGAETIYTFLSDPPDSAFHGAPVAVRNDGGAYRTVFVDFPLYHLLMPGAQDLVETALDWFATSTGVGGGSASAARFAIRAEPNPLGAHGTTLRFALPQRSDVDLAIYSVSGRRVRSLARGARAAGIHAVNWDGRNESGERVSSGIYFYRIDAGGQKATGKIVLLR
ncbi:MAG: M20/M25/M40 family metallo-hydrolase [Gemmatimonadetes bacterium]|nr:M20/M25/M40 family metallo-hydrolase [Gemmatimonadota bacterium]